MVTVTPQGIIYLCNTPLENDYKNQLTFTTAQKQLEYFNSKVIKEFDNYTYIKKDNVIKLGVNIDEIIGCNYLFYKNTGFTNKWYFCFISNKEYINENVTAITIETDVFQTYQFDVTYKTSFIEREHVNSDGYGEHTVPEALETGEYIYQDIQTTDIGDSHIVILSTVNPTTLTANSGGMYGGVPSGALYYLCRDNTALNSALNNLANNGKADSVLAVFLAPDFITGYDYIHTSWDTMGLYLLPNTTSAATGTGIAFNINPTTIDGYTPKNKKCFINPYYTFIVSNNQGGSMVYNIEDFYDNGTHTGGLNLYGVISAGASVRLIPENYKVTNKSFEIEDDPTYKYETNEYGLTMGKLPIGSWSSDVYTNWLTQNGVSIALNTTDGLLNQEIGDHVGHLNTIGNSVISIWQHSLVPTEARGNINSGDVTYGHGLMTYTTYISTIKREYAKIIDDYFSAFGYKVNAYKTPNITGRAYWNYVKTIDCNIEGNIPTEHLNILKGVFNKGITFWHDPTKFLDYSQNNAIV